MMDLTKSFLIPMMVLFLGMIFILLGILEGDANIALFLFFPVIYGTGIYLMLGILLIFISFLLFFIFPFRTRYTSHRGRSEKNFSYNRQEEKELGSTYGGVIFIGPIPIFFGKDVSTTKKMMWIGLVIALILAFLYLMIIFL